MTGVRPKNGDDLDLGSNLILGGFFTSKGCGGGACVCVVFVAAVVCLSATTDDDVNDEDCIRQLDIVHRRKLVDRRQRLSIMVDR